MDGPIFVRRQTATQPLDHGRVVWGTDNADVIRLEKTPHEPDKGKEPPPAMKFVGEGIATYDIKFIYQPTEESFPCLVSNPRFRYRVFWSDEHGEYVATPVDSGEMNQSSRWLHEAVRTMNALHDFWRGGGKDSNDHDPPLSPVDGPDSSLVITSAEIMGTLAAAAAKVWLRSP